MRVVHVNLFDKQGGAAKVAWTLMEGMTSLGHDVHIFAHRKTTDDKRVIPIPFPPSAWQKKLLRQQAAQGLFALFPAALLNVLNSPLFDKADLVHLHCINGGYFSFLLLPFLTAKPTVWTLHDPLAFTGGCLNTDACQEWERNWCAHCPLDAAKQTFSMQRELVQLIKTSMYKLAKFTAVCPSKWLERQARQSILQGQDIRMIHNGIDTDCFRPGNRNKLRAKLGLPVDKKIIMFAAHGGFNNELKGGAYLLTALRLLHDRYPDMLLLNIGMVDNSRLAGLPLPHCDIPFLNDARQLAEYYAAADLFVSPSLVENLSLAIGEAMACGTPVVAFAVGGTPELILHRENGYLAQRGDSSELAHGIAYFLDNDDARIHAGAAARQRITDNFNACQMIDNYMKLYEELLISAGGPGLLQVPVQHWIKSIPQEESLSWEYRLHEFRKLYNSFAPEETQERAIFIDRFFRHCLLSVSPVSQSAEFWDILKNWQYYRQLATGYVGVAPAEQEALVAFGQILRDKLKEYLTHSPPAELSRLNELRQKLLVTIWWQVFLHPFSPLALQPSADAVDGCKQDQQTGQGAPDWYIKLMVASMYQPFAADCISLNLAELWQAPLPLAFKIVFVYWLLNVPFFNITENDRHKILRYAPALRHISLPMQFFPHFIGAIMECFWRVSYAGGNNLEALSAFGDFIATHMARFFPQYASNTCREKRRQDKEKVRIGYISRNFRNQAVSYYMVNRVLHHDKDKFEVYVFSLSEVQDWMTELFKTHSDQFEQFTNLGDIEDMASRIAECRLDILIYTDIGMDPVTYMLSGLKLAPVQAALAGHGTTTGMPTIQYYISGDFEPANAQEHYREKLICLPRLGAAQYPPTFRTGPLPTRRDWKIPEDVVVFVSCANGIKHGPQRDELLIEILRQATNACIVLKPYFAGNIESIITDRLMAKARAAGVDKRLFIIPPLAHVEALLAISDVQLDTYPYGGWTTNLEALYTGLPIVTQEGELARSRWGAHMLRALGITEGIAANEEEYVAWAVRFAQDGELRRQVSRRIREKAKNALFNGAAAQPAYEAALIELLSEK